MDGGLVATYTSSPYIHDYTLPGEVSGGNDFTLYAVAGDLQGNEAVSIPVTIHSGIHIDLAAIGELHIAADDMRFEHQNILINIGVVTIDGIHVFNNIHIQNNGVLSHSETDTENEYDLILTATHLSIDETSKIDVSGCGYIGGGTIETGQFGRTLGNVDGSQRWRYVVMKNEPKSVFMLKLNQQIFEISCKGRSAAFVCPVYFPSHLAVVHNDNIHIVDKATHLHRIDVHSLEIPMPVDHVESLSGVSL